MTDVIRYDKDADGIVTLTLDDPNQRANTMNDDFRASLSATIDTLENEDGLTGVIVTSAKDTFFAGGDLRQLIQVSDENAAEFSR